MRGRPIGSIIRQNMIEILYFMKEGCGYDLYAVYIHLFPKVTLRSIYYHLNKGIDTGEFKIKKAGKVKGEYSWGTEAEKVYYELGNNAKPSLNERIKKHFDKK